MEQLRAPVNVETIRQILENRNDAVLSGSWDAEIFYAFNFDTIEAIELQLPAATSAINWRTVTEQELLKLVIVNEKSPLNDQVNEIITGLKDPEGITLRMEGHTSGVKTRNRFFL